MKYRRYRKRPVEIEAVTVSELLSTPMSRWPDWCVKAYEAGKMMRRDKSFLIFTLEGEMWANVDSYIVRGVDGELYPVRGDIFVRTYEPVD